MVMGENLRVGASRTAKDFGLKRFLIESRVDEFERGFRSGRLEPRGREIGRKDNGGIEMSSTSRKRVRSEARSSERRRRPPSR